MGRHRREWWRWLAAAAIVVVMALGLLFDRLRPLTCEEAIARYGEAQATFMFWRNCP